MKSTGAEKGLGWPGPSETQVNAALWQREEADP